MPELAEATGLPIGYLNTASAIYERDKDTPDLLYIRQVMAGAPLEDVTMLADEEKRKRSGRPESRVTWMSGIPLVR